MRELEPDARHMKMRRQCAGKRPGVRNVAADLFGVSDRLAGSNDSRLQIALRDGIPISRVA